MKRESPVSASVKQVVTKPIEAKVSVVLAQAQKMVVKNNDQLLVVSEFLKTIKALRAEVDQTFDPIIAAAHASHKEACNQKRKVEAPLVQAEGVVKPLIAAYMAAKERERLEEQRRLQRLADEAAAVEEEKKRVALALAAEKAGDVERAAEILFTEPEVPVVAAKVVVRDSRYVVPKTEGVSISTLWVADVVDFEMLVKAVADGKVPMLALQANMVFLGQQARSMKAELNYPGVKATSRANVSARS